MDSVIYLGDVIETIEHGEPIETITWTKVYAEKKSVRQSEYYEARNTGLKPEFTFEVYNFEFNNHEKVKYNDKVYDIIRTYEKGEKTELTVTGTIGGEI